MAADVDALLDQIMDQMLRGQSVDVEALLAQHPELTDAQQSKIRKVVTVMRGEPRPAQGASPETVPLQVGPYKIIKTLGRGGMGVVYLARQETLGRHVALKVIQPTLASSLLAGQRFQREAQAIAQLRHPNIITVYDAGEADGVAFLAMELVPGRGLDEILAEHSHPDNPLPTVEVIRYLRDIARALAASHAAGIIHRDIKPSNIRVTPDDRAMLVDFGLARGAGLETVSQEATFRGTVAYASPEQVAAEATPIDGRSDLYSLGVTLYECITGKVPFEGETTEQLFHQILVQRPRYPRRLNPAISRDLEAVVLGCLEKDPRDRYACADDLAEDLDALLEMRPVSIQPQSWSRLAVQWMRRHRAAALALVLLAVLALGGPLGYALLERSAKRRVQTERDEVLRLSDALVIRNLVASADDLWPMRPPQVPALESWLEQVRQLMKRRPNHEATFRRLDGLLEPDAEATDLWRHETTEQLLNDLTALAALGEQVAARLRFAQTVVERTVTEHEQSFEDLIDEIAIADAYGGLEIEPQVGLVPLGLDPDSGLAEFCLLESGEVPVRDPQSHALIPAEAMAVVLVLIPGGFYTMGSSLPGPGGLANVDPHSRRNEQPPHGVDVAPFLLAKYELTQSQWLRLAGFNPSTYTSRTHDGRKQVTPLHPLESVTWDEAQEFLRRHELRLPREVEWEFACRAGTSSPWWMGESKNDLAWAANVADQFCRNNGGHPTWTYEPWDDGYVMHAPIGTYRANPFGLHDMLGNVGEWCEDIYRFYDRPEDSPDPTHLPSPNGRIARGGSYLSPASEARCAVRYVFQRDANDASVGLRVVRDLH